MNLGIVQGRLSPPVDNKIQEFPERWKEEFVLLRHFGLNHIEWIFTKKTFPQNLQLDLRNYSFEINSICCDHLIDKRITDSEFLSKYLRSVCEFALYNNIKSITIPLLEESKISIAEFSQFTDKMLHYGEIYPELFFCFEMDAPYQLAVELAKKSNNFLLTFDTGNITDWGYEPSAYLFAIKKYLANVHLKDVHFTDSHSIWPGAGKTDFDLIFKTLAAINYTSTFTLQTARGEDGREWETIRKHTQYFKELYEKHF